MLFPMKFRQTNSFFSHCSNAFPEHLCPFYLLIIPDDYERKICMDYVKKIFEKTSVYVKKYQAEDALVGKIIQECSSLNFFSNSTLIIIDQIQKMNDLAKFSQNIQKMHEGYFLIGTPSSKGVEKLEKNIEKNGVILDLSQEKPWERQERIVHHLRRVANKENITITEKALERLIQKISLDLASLEQELRKLICYAKESKKITEKEVNEAIADLTEPSVWQLAQFVIWDRKYPNISFVDNSVVSLFLIAIRQQLQFGWELTNLIEKNAKNIQIQAHFPKVWPKLLEQRKKQIPRFPPSYFTQGLKDLFSLELTLRDSVKNATIPIDLFLTKMFAL